MNQEVKTINGYAVKDEIARNLIDDIKKDKAELIFPKFMENARSGDANLIKYKNKVIMIDCYHSDQWSEIKTMLDDNNIDHIDYFILTHYHVDHHGNFLNLIQNGYINSETNLYFPSELTQVDWVNDPINAIKSYCNTYNLNYYVPEENEVLTIGNLKLTFYNTDPLILYEKYYEGQTSPDYNNTSTVVLIEHNNIRMLYTGDASHLCYKRLREDNFVKGKIDFFKIGHHGINMNTDVDFIKGISPEFAVLPSGIIDHTRNNQSISREVYLLRENNTKIYPQHMQTEYIRFITNGSKIKCTNGKPYNLAVWNIVYDIYVDSNASTSDIQDGTQEHPFSEIMQAINFVDTNVNCEINIHLADGEYGHPHSGEVNKNIVFIRTGRKAILNINGNSNDRTAVSITGCKIENSCVKFNNLTIDMDYSSGVNGGIYAYNSDVFLDNVLIDSLTNTPSNNSCVRGAINSNISIFNNSKLNNGNYGVQMYGGSLFLYLMRFGTFTSGTLSLTRTPYYTDIIYFDNDADKKSFKYHLLTQSPKLLYSGQSHTEVSCYDNLSNYDWIEIFGTTNDNMPFSSGRIYNPSSRNLSLNCSFITQAGGYRIKSCYGSISDNVLTLSRQTQIDITSAGEITVNNNSGYLDIRRIIGGKNDYQDIR